MFFQRHGEPARFLAVGCFADAGTAGGVALGVFHVIVENEKVGGVYFVKKAGPGEVVGLVDGNDYRFFIVKILFHGNGTFWQIGVGFSQNPCPGGKNNCRPLFFRPVPNDAQMVDRKNI